MCHRSFGLSLLLAFSLSACMRREESEVQGQMAHYGFDYARIKRRAVTDLAALRGFFIFSGLTDGAAGVGYEEDMMELLETCGEGRFLEAIDSVQDKEVQARILRFLGYDRDQGKGPKDWARFTAQFPRLSTLIDRQSTQQDDRVTLERKGFFEEIDWSVVTDDFNGTMFERVHLRWGNQTVSLLGFEPSLVEGALLEGRARGNVLELWVGSRPHGHLFLVREGGRLFGAKVISARSSSEGHGLCPDDVLDALRRRKDETPFLPLDPNLIYVESWLYDDLAKRGVKIPSYCWRFPDASIEPRDD